MKKTRKLTSGQIYDALVAPMASPPPRRIFRQWISFGQRYASLAAAGKPTCLLRVLRLLLADSPTVYRRLYISSDGRRLP